MNLIPCKKSDMRKTPKANVFGIIKEFVNSGAECALVAGADEHYVNPNVGARSLNSAILRYKFAGVRAVSNDGKLYLVREARYERR